MKRWLFFFLVLSLVFASALFASPLAEDPGGLSNEQILSELDRNEAFMKGALSAIAADKEDREVLRNEVRYLIDLNLTVNRSVNALLTWLQSSGAERLIPIVIELEKWRWREFCIGAGAGVAVMVLGGLLAPRIWGTP